MMFGWLLLAVTSQGFQLQLEFDPPIPKVEARSIQHFLEADQRQLPSPLLIKRLHRDIDLMHRFAERTCRRQSGSTRIFVCRLVESPRVRNVKIEGRLPYSILRSDILRRAILRPGKRLPIKEYKKATKQPDTVSEKPDHWAHLSQRAQQRIKEYIDSQGFTNSKVEVQVQKLSNAPGRVDVLIKVIPGKPHRWGKITVQGLTTREQREVKGRLRPLTGPFREDILQTRLESEEQRLRKSGYVEVHADYELTTNNDVVDIVITFQLGPNLKQTFHGKLLAPASLLKTKSTFETARSAGPRQMEATVKALKGYYQRRGYFRPEVLAQDPEEASLEVEERSLERQAKAILADPSKDRRDAMNRVTQRRIELRERRRQLQATRRQSRHIAFHINPGRHARCVDVRIAGIPRELQQQILEEGILATKPPISGRHDGYILDEDVTADQERIRSWMERRGWLVTDVSTVLRQKGEGEVQVIFPVIASEPSYIRSVSLVGVSDGEEDDEGNPTEDLYDDLMEALDIRPGSPFLENTPEELRRRTLRFYRVRGYPTTEVDSMVGFLADGVSTRLIIQEGRRVLYGGMILTGMERTQREKIHEVFTAKTGEPFDPQVFHKGAAILRSWRVFRRVSVQFLGLEEGREKIWVHIAVQENTSRTLDLTLGFSIEDYFQAALRYRDRNILGRAWSWDTLGAYGLLIGRRSELRSTLKMPRLLGAHTDFSLEPRLFYREPSRAALWDDDFQWKNDANNLLILRAAAKIAHRVSAFTTLKADYAYSLERDQTGDEDVEISTGATTFEANWLRVDNPFNPHQGLQLRGSVKLAAPFLLGDSYFLSTVGQASAYIPVGRSTLATNFRGGSVLELTDQANVPPSDLFRLGGDRSVRGFPQDWIRLTHPAAVDSDVGRDGHANVFALGSLEWRIPVGEQNAGGGMAFSFFSDLGWVASELEGSRRTNMGWSNGLAVNYVLPIGPVGLVVAHQTIQPDFDESYLDRPEPDDYQLVALPSALNRFGYHLTMGYVF